MYLLRRGGIVSSVENTENIQRTVAEQFIKPIPVLGGNYDYSYFDYARMKGMRNHTLAAGCGRRSCVCPLLGLSEVRRQHAA
ncbi:MAG: YugN-like family protein [Lentimicrobium sp.]|uniref:hypothetical protein n=1 Tax=Lentimicrobium sp. TaxID=2034841 RepID=UPI0025DAC4FD|nr:hypothetical protein [Lentimicrobium sp.]MCO5258257.1 YugN-like family protein [Lentimicrobium sp.]